MKIEDHVEKIRIKVVDAVRNTLDRCGITKEGCRFNQDTTSENKIGNVEQLIEAIKSEKSDWNECFGELVDDYAFTLFNRLVCLKVLEAHGLYPEMITQRQQHSGKAYSHYMWLESNSQYRDSAFEGLDKYIQWQFEQLADECDLFNTTIPLHMIPTAVFLKEIIDLINAVDDDEQIDDEIWKRGNILSQIYEIYNNTKKAELKASGDKVEYDKVHVQSQIYTPEWVVKFLVDNSLGKMYLEMFPDSEIKDTHKIIGDYNTQLRDIKPLDEIKVIDPCVGSGNFLLYCFDILYDMYMDQIENYGADYSKREIPGMIIEKNLHGIDLDERAVQLTKIGLFIKAKTKRNGVKIEHYNIVSASFRLPAYSEVGLLFDAKFFSKDFSKLMEDIWKDLQQAHKFGSLLKINEKFEEKKKELKEDINDAQLSIFTYEKAIELDIFEKNFYKKLADAVSSFAVSNKKKFWANETSEALVYLKIMASKYDVVVSNPPYTEGSVLGSQMGIFISENYRQPYNFSANLYACFINKNIELLSDNGLMALIHPHTFMTIDAYKDVRRFMLQNGCIEVLVDYGLDRVNLFGPGILLDAVWYSYKKGKNEDDSIYINITDNLQEKYKKQELEKCLSFMQMEEYSSNRVFGVNQSTFNDIPGMPIIYKLSSEMRQHFKDHSLDEYVKVAGGMTSGCNEQYVRLWWEIEDDGKKWFKYMKGGPFCKWSGNEWARINWENDGQELRNSKRSILRNKEYYLKDGITYTGSGSKGTTFRVMPQNALFDAGGSCIFPTGAFNNLKYIIAFMNSRLSFYLIDCLNPTVNTQVGDLKRIPFVKPSSETEKKISELAHNCIEIKKSIDEKYILNGSNESPLILSTTVTSAVKSVIMDELAGYTQILINEAMIDECINHIYELNPDDLARMTDKMGVCVANIPVYSKAVEEFVNNIGINEECIDFINALPSMEYDESKFKELIETVANALYSKNNEMEDFCRSNDINPITVWYIVKSQNVIPHIKAKDLVFEWMTYAIRDILQKSEDGIIPITSTDVSFLDLLEAYADREGITSAQLLQMEEYLGKRIRDFVEQDFFEVLMNYTNVFMYLPKTPFVWHLSSGDYRGFEALILIYKWNADSLYKIKSNYVSRRREKLEFRKTQLASSNTAQAVEEKELIDKQLKEIESFVAKIDELIMQGYNPILDDGVGKNIAPLQEKKMLKADVLNPNQLKKYLKAEW